MPTRESLSTDVLAMVLIGDSVFNVVPNQWIRDDLQRLDVPHGLRFVLASAKAAGGIGLLLRRRHSGLARAASAGLVVYFGLAVGAHARARDEAWRYGSAVALLGWSGLTYRRIGHATDSKPAS